MALVSRVDAIDDALAATVALFVTAFRFATTAPLRHPFVDDAAIVLRYLDNFARGYFYTYNIPDGPVFGISGFLYGVVAGGLAYAGLAPETSLVVVNLLGSLLLFTALGVLGKQLVGRRWAVLALPILVGIGAEYVGPSLFNGLETALHLALVTWTLVAFFAESDLVYLLAALCVISKLDALGIAGVLVVAALVRAQGWRHWRVCRAALLGFVGPIVAVAAFEVWTFGSPLPQSFIAKQFYQARAAGSAFPFLARFVSTRDIPRWSFAACAALGVLGVAAAAAPRGRPRAQLLVLHVLALVAFGQYLFYSPDELMPWYFPLPELMLRLAALAVVPLWVLAPQRPQVLPATVVAVLIGIAFVPRIAHWQEPIRESHAYLDTVESERIRVAQEASRVTPSNRTLLTGHGYVARAFNGYVVDYSGLNSPGATRLHLDQNAMFDVFQPATVVEHGSPSAEIQRKHHLVLASSYYDVTFYGGYPFRIFVVEPSRSELAIEIPSDAVQLGTHSATFQLGGQSIRLLAFGVTQRDLPQHLRWTSIAGDIPADHGTCDVPARAAANCWDGHCAIECAIRPNAVRADRLIVESDAPLIPRYPVLVRTMPSELAPLAARH